MLYVNLEGRAQMTRRAIFAPNLAKDDVEILVELAQELVSIWVSKPHASAKITGQSISGFCKFR